MSLCVCKTAKGESCSRKQAAGCKSMCKQHFNQHNKVKESDGAAKPAATKAATNKVAAGAASGASEPLEELTATGKKRCQGRLAKTGLQCTAPVKVGDRCGRHLNNGGGAAVRGPAAVQAPPQWNPLSGVPLLDIYMFCAKTGFLIVSETNSTNADEPLDGVFYGCQRLMKHLDVIQKPNVTEEEVKNSLREFHMAPVVLQNGDEAEWNEISDDTLYVVLDSKLSRELITWLIDAFAHFAKKMSPDDPNNEFYAFLLEITGDLDINMEDLLASVPESKPIQDEGASNADVDPSQIVAGGQRVFSNLIERAQRRIEEEAVDGIPNLFGESVDDHE